MGLRARRTPAGLLAHLAGPRDPQRLRDQLEAGLVAVLLDLRPDRRQVDLRPARRRGVVAADC